MSRVGRPAGANTRKPGRPIEYLIEKRTPPEVWEQRARENRAKLLNKLNGVHYQN